MADPTTLEVLIQIREELAGLNRTRVGLQGAKKDAEGLGTAIRQGLGIGTGIQMVTSAVSLLKNSLQATAGAALQMAGEIKDGAEALTISGEAYQVYKLTLKAASVEMARFAMAVTEQTQSMAAARSGAGGAADAYRDLGLTLAQIEGLSADERVLAIVRATLQATDQTKALNAAGQLLGQRGIRQLVSGLSDLAENGYGKVSKSLRDLHQLWDDDTTGRLDRAGKNIEKLKNAAVIQAGELIGAADMAWQSAKKDFWGTALASLVGLGTPMGGAYFSTVVAGNQPKTAAPKPPPPPSAPSNARLENVLEARLGNAEAKAAAIQNASLMDETQKRRALLPVLDEQARLYEQIIKQKFGDSAKNLPANGEVTDEELAKYRERNELEWKLAEIRRQRMETIDTPLEALWRQMNDTTSLIQNSLTGALGQGISQLGSDIWEAMKDTQDWGDAWRNLGDIAGRMLTQMITQMLVVAAINQMLGLFGYGMSGGPGIVKLGTPTVKAAGGGSFLTRGPTNFTVGDNPGGVELVSVLPLSGIGRTTVGGQALRMAGGGAALVAGGSGFSRTGETVVVNVTNHFGGGVSRGEFLGAMPALVTATKNAVLEATRRRRDGY